MMSDSLHDPADFAPEHGFEVNGENWGLCREGADIRLLSIFGFLE
jgi:hypothetical protein